MFALPPPLKNWPPTLQPSGLVQMEGHPMSAIGGKADVIQGVAEGPLIAKSGHSDPASATGGYSRIGHSLQRRQI